MLPVADRVSAVVVGYAHPVGTANAVSSLLAQSLPPAEILVVDNDPGKRNSVELERRELAQSVRIVSAGRNLGYTRGVNLAAERARGDWLFLLNPDAVAAEDCLAQLVGAAEPAATAIVGAQVLLPDGRVNAGDNPINLAGVSWSGGYGEQRDRGEPRDTAAVSGAALMVRRHAFEQLGGLCPHFFLYQDDADLAWRARLAGWRVRYCPAALVVHDFEFDRGPRKWFYLERNRGWVVLSNFAPSTLVLLAPLLLATEVAVVARAAREGWLGAKLGAWGSLLTSARKLIAWRWFVQRRRKVSDHEVLQPFHGGIETDLLESALLRRVNPWLERYRAAVLAVLRRLEGP